MNKIRFDPEKPSEFSLFGFAGNSKRIKSTAFQHGIKPNHFLGGSGDHEIALIWLLVKLRPAYRTIKTIEARV